ncbi:hypothetical protein BGZ68_004824, partial [Mortierella alpina]
MDQERAFGASGSLHATNGTLHHHTAATTINISSTTTSADSPATQQSRARSHSHSHHHHISNINTSTAAAGTPTNHMASAGASGTSGGLFSSSSMPSLKSHINMNQHSHHLDQFSR